MYSRKTDTPLILEIGDRTVTFASLDDFGFALSSRTGVPEEKITGLMQLSDQELEEEARAIKRAAKRLIGIIANAIEDQTTVGRDLQMMDPKLFTHDHQWRAIMSGLNRQAPKFDAFKKLALVRYAQYLAARHNLTQSIYTERQHQAGRSTSPSGDEGDDMGPQGMKDTLLFELMDVMDAPETGRAFVRLPKGERVAIPLEAGRDLEIILSGHMFRLVSGSPPHLADENGQAYPLRAGTNIIGRDPESDVVVAPSLTDVSRKHLILEVADSTVVRLTDVSSHGTMIRRKRLDKSLASM